MEGRPSRKEALRRGWSVVCRHWRPMAVYSLAIWALSALLLAPPTAWILNWLGASSDEVIVGNYGIPGWLVSPRGILYSLLFGSVVVLGFVLQVTGLFWMARDAHEGSVVSARNVVLRVLWSFPSLFRFSTAVFVAGLVGLTPLAAGFVLIYFLLLRGHTIHYYLANKPPAWSWALGAAGLWGLLWGCAAVYIILRCAYFLPAWLDGEQPLRRALRVSWQATRGSSRYLLRTLGICIGLAILASGLVEFLIFGSTDFALMRFEHSMSAIIFVISAYLVVSSACSVIFGFVGTAWTTCVWLMCYLQQVPAQQAERSAGAIPNTPLEAAQPLIYPRRFAVVVIGMLLASVAISVWILSQESTPNTPLVIAHRAGPAYAPENSLAAMQQVVEQGVSDFVELDVQLTRDRQVVVAHDKDLQRIAQDPRLIGETNFDDLADVDIGRLFHSDFQGQRIGRLADFLKFAKGRLRLIIEFKRGEPLLIDRTLQLVHEYDMQNDVKLMSLEIADVRYAQSRAGNIPVGYLAAVEPGNLTGLDVDFIATDQKLATRDLIRQIHKRGLPIYCWTVNKPKRVLELTEMGIDGVITDDPPMAADVIVKYRELDPPQRLLLRFRGFWDVFDNLGWWPFGEEAEPQA